MALFIGAYIIIFPIVHFGAPALGFEFSLEATAAITLLFALAVIGSDHERQKQQQNTTVNVILSDQQLEQELEKRKGNEVICDD